MKHADLINTLTLEQKCALLAGKTTFGTRAMPGKGIPSITLSDGPNGVRKQAGAADHLGLNPSVPATCFPTAVTMAGSWDPALGEQVGAAMGEEAAAQEVAVLLGPGLNIKRSPLCGRNFEYFSEDPYLAGKMAAGYVRGIQHSGIAACPKHFAVNSQELRRMASDSVLDERTLREIYLTGFEIVVREAKPRSIMSAYNCINGTYANENRHLLMDILRDEWGFEGAVVTDWGGSNDHALGVKNGSTLEMPAPGGDAVRELLAAVASGRIAESDVDARVDELLELVLCGHKAVQEHSRTFDAQAHHALARQAAAESAVLLKNQDHLLPLPKGAKVALIGDFADVPRYQGAGSSAVNALQVDTAREMMAHSGLQCIGYAQGFDRHGRPDAALQAEAVLLAQNADAVLLYLGLDEIKESEGLDRPDMKLAENQIALLHAVSQANPNVVVVLSAGASVETPWLGDCKALLYGALSGQAGAGALLDLITGRQNPSGKLAETWAVSYQDTPARDHFGGDGRAVQYREGLYVLLDLITGRQNPSGKLAETWAVSYQDTPARDHFGGDGRAVQYREGLYVGYRYYQTAGVPSGKLAETWAVSYQDTPARDHFGGDGRAVQYREGLYVGYRYYQTAGVHVAFPFGHGLSYTTFAYSDLMASPEGAKLTVTNTGNADGAEVVQLYVAIPI